MRFTILPDVQQLVVGTRPHPPAAIFRHCQHIPYRAIEQFKAALPLVEAEQSPVAVSTGPKLAFAVFEQLPGMRAIRFLFRIPAGKLLKTLCGRIVLMNPPTPGGHPDTAVAVAEQTGDISARKAVAAVFHKMLIGIGRAVPAADAVSVGADPDFAIP